MSLEALDYEAGGVMDLSAVLRCMHRSSALMRIVLYGIIGERNITSSVSKIPVCNKTA